MVEFNAEKHEYRYCGVRFPSVSEVLGSVAVMVAEKWTPISGPKNFYTERSRIFGNAFHACAGYEMQGIEYQIDPAMAPWIQQFNLFKKAHIKGAIEMVEKPLAHPKMKYAGTPDLVTLDYKKRLVWIWDWKTAESFMPHWKCQLEAYKELVLQALGMKSGTRVKLNTVRFFADKYVIDPCNDPLAANTFRSALNLFNQMQRSKAA